MNKAINIISNHSIKKKFVIKKCFACSKYVKVTTDNGITLTAQRCPHCCIEL